MLGLSQLTREGRKLEKLLERLRRAVRRANNVPAVELMRKDAADGSDVVEVLRARRVLPALPVIHTDIGDPDAVRELLPGDARALPGLAYAVAGRLALEP